MQISKPNLNSPPKADQPLAEKFKVTKNKLILILMIVLASFFRLYGVNWDQGHHLHPDERFLTMVATAIKIPSTIGDYLNPQVSTMSPYNNNYGFFVYGTLPLNIVKVLGEWTKQNTYDTIHLLGRQVSAFFDIGVVLLVFLIGKKLWSERVGLWSAFLYAVMVLPIQLSHFFAVDTFLTFFIVLSFYLLVLLITDRRSLITAGALGGAFGFALACKISALYFTPIIALGFLFLLIKSIRIRRIFPLIVSCLLFSIFCLLSFRLGHPTAFATGNLLNLQPNPKFLANLKELAGYSDPNNWFPPAVQWKSVKPILFPFGNLIMWGLGLPLGLLALAAVGHLIAKLLHCFIVKVKKGFKVVFAYDTCGTCDTFVTSVLIVLWILGLFFYQGSQTASTIRYFLPIYPFIALLGAQFVATTFPKILKLSKIPKVILFITFYSLLLIYPLSFLSIYSRPITRVSASEWIFNNISKGSTIVNEEWDDGLPLNTDQFHTWQTYSYSGKSVFMYDEDTPEKWARIQPIIDQADYYITSSNRAYGGLMRLPKRNPETIKFYQGMFDGTGAFYKVAEFTSRPCFPPFGNKHLFCFNDDNAEESFTVYDHPKVMIFKKK